MFDGTPGPALPLGHKVFLTVLQEKPAQRSFGVAQSPPHTTATHLLRSGVDINTIRAWLGHVSLETTNVYAEVDLETKARALATCEVEGKRKVLPWKEDKGLMEFLRTL